MAELAYRTPKEWLMRGGENKYLLRALARRQGLVPEAISGRKKFGAPLAASWMDEDKGFSVRDRRIGASDAGSDQPNPQPEGAAAQGPAQESASPQDLDFSTFVISLASSAKVNLGAIPHPETNQTSQNFPAAKQMLDILAMLRQKTKGNLTEAESALLDQVLFNLRLHYVRSLEGQKKSGG